MKAFAVNVPGDGTCMFHAVGYALKLNGHGLRKLVVDYIANNKDSYLHETALKDWILWDKNMTIETYVHHLRRGMWGGALETTILASLLKTPIFVYEPKGKLCVRISESRPDTQIISIGKSLDYICILYTGKNHYMALVTN